MSIQVYTINPGSGTGQLATLFRSSNLFRFNVVNIACENNYSNGNQFLGCLVDDLNNYTAILRGAKNNSNQMHVLIIQSGMKSIVGAKNLEVLMSRLSADTSTDVFYLYKYGDRCDKYQNFQPAEYRGIPSGFTIAETTEPSNGIHALLFSPAGRDKILNYVQTNNPKFSTVLADMIRQGALNVKIITPNVFNVDLSSTSEYHLANECQVVKGKSNSNTTTNTGNSTTLSIWWFVIVVAIVLIVAILAIWFGSRKLGVSNNSK